MVSVPMESEPAGLVGVLNVHTVAHREFADRDIRCSPRSAGSSPGRCTRRGCTAGSRRASGRTSRFTEQMVAAQEAERHRLAGDIHDGISQRLVTPRLPPRRRPRHPATADAAAAARRTAGHGVASWPTTLDEARAAIGALRPPSSTTSGSPAALASLARGLPDVACRPRPRGQPAARARRGRALPDRPGGAAERPQARRRGGGHGAPDHRVDRRAARARRRRRGVRCRGPSGRGRTGYGLASVRERAELVGGSVRVTSRPGTGTTVTVTAPVDSEPFDEVSPHNT